jgi:hypothetical protein
MSSFSALPTSFTLTAAPAVITSSRQGKARQNKLKQDKKKQDKTKSRQDKPSQAKIRHDKDKTRQYPDQKIDDWYFSFELVQQPLSICFLKKQIVIRFLIYGG